MPLAITDVHTDTGGDTKFVTTTITGAGFNPQAVVNWFGPASPRSNRSPIRWSTPPRSLPNSTCTAAIHGLYDLVVINPDGNQAIVPYRFLVTQTVEPEVTIGVGGPRYIFAGDTGTYSVALQNLGNIDAPYTYFTVGIPEIRGTNYRADNLPYLAISNPTSPAARAGQLAESALGDAQFEQQHQRREPHVGLPAQ